MIKKLEYFHVQHTLFAMSDKIIYIKNPYAGKKRKAWNKPTKPLPNKWKRKLAKSDKGSYYIIICIGIIITIIIIIIIIVIKNLVKVHK